VLLRKRPLAADCQGAVVAAKHCADDSALVPGALTRLLFVRGAPMLCWRRCPLVAGTGPAGVLIQYTRIIRPTSLSDGGVSPLPPPQHQMLPPAP
jgi:hypothetical protein